MKYDVYSRFDIEKHKENFVHYLEVMIDEDGTILYAVPSHQEKAIALACEKHNIGRAELMHRCPQEYYGDFLTWLLRQSGAIAVWERFYAGLANAKQRAALAELRAGGLYTGDISEEEQVLRFAW